ncbi:MAG: hypothetical protein EYC70_02760 [Planctomycetota bacterium]|nr:MAG: hypothetical protein EYC70_02760 [Planctomycetota bacterium]
MSCEQIISAIGAGAFGAVIGWYTYYSMRRFKEYTVLDLATLVGALGGAGITALFGESKSLLFGCYAIGLALGFFGYVLVMLCVVSKDTTITMKDLLHPPQGSGVGGVMGGHGRQQQVLQAGQQPGQQPGPDH